MITNSSANYVLNTLFSGTKYVALMNADPTQAGLFTNEMSGDGYVRKQCTFTSASNRTVSNSTNLWWSDLPNTPIRYIAVCTALSGGSMIGYIATGSDIYVAEGYKFVVTGGNLAFSIT